MANFQKKGSWVLTVDIDEFLDLPEITENNEVNCSLEDYCNHLQKKKCTFAAALLLDMMPQTIEPGAQLSSFINIYNFFYCRPVSRYYDYCENKEIQWAFGDHWYISFSVDIRYRLFGTIDSLRKIPIFRYYPGVDLNQGYHNLIINGIPLVWEQIFTQDQEILPIRHYKMAKILDEGKMFDDILERKDQYFFRTQKNLEFIQSISKEYAKRTWELSPFKTKYSGCDNHLLSRLLHKKNL
jgi:hypothetical protein